MQHEIPDRELTLRVLPGHNDGLFRTACFAPDLGYACFEVTLLRDRLLRGYAVIHLRAVHSQRAIVIEHQPVEAERSALGKRLEV